MSELTARETGTTAAKGLAYVEDFPMVDDPTQGLVSRTLLSQIETVGTREFLLDGRFLPGISELTLDAELVRVKDHGKTRGESRHAILFGQLLLSGEDEAEHSLFVAVKPFSGSLEAAKEYSVTSYMAAGNIEGCDTFRPVGVTRNRAGNPAMITLYQHPVRSMDGIFWNEDLVHEESIVDKALGRAAVALARLHSAGWVHGDFEVKNAAWDVTNSKDTSFIIDLEDAEPVSHLSGEEQDRRKLQDISVFIGSLFRLREIGEELPTDYENQVKEYFGLVYTGIRDDLAKSESSINYSAISRIVDSGQIA